MADVPPTRSLRGPWTKWKLCVGVDMGGTNTDAVLMGGGEVLSWCKATTTADVATGVERSIDEVLRRFLANERCAGLSYAQLVGRVSRVCIGTTHFVNAVVERRRRDLAEVAVVRLCGDSSRALPAFCDFPRSLARCMEASPQSCFFARGGYDFDATPMEAVDREEIHRIGRLLNARGIHHVAISGVFTTLNGDQEREVEVYLREVVPKVSITLSHKVGQMGLLQRENAGIMNESLKPLCRRTVEAFGAALARLELTCPFYLTKNDGTLISATHAMALPVATFSCGPTNSMRGAHYLSGLLNAVVVDIGGTTSDAGVIKDGFPRQASSEVRVAGVSICFNMPDTLSIGLGGGSLVRQGETKVTVGRDSVGYELMQRAKVAGGEDLTASDIAVACGLAEQLKTQIGAELCEQRLSQVDPDYIAAANVRIQEMFAELVDIVKGSTENVDVILVGGGSVLIDADHPPPGITIVKPPHCQVANAVGAALGQISGRCDGIYSLEIRDDAAVARQHELYRRRAIEDCVRNGALESTVVVRELVETVMGYIPGNNYQIRVVAIGDVDEEAARGPREREEGASDESCLLHCCQDRAHLADEAPGQDENLETLVYTPRQYDRAGYWTLKAYDVECIVIGAGLFGCGGGGSPSLARLRCLRVLAEGRAIRIVQPDRIGSCAELTGCIGNVAFMGSPLVITEKLVAGNEVNAAVRVLHRLMNRETLGDIEETTQENGVVVYKDGSGLEGLCTPEIARAARCNPLPDAPCRIVALKPLEIGGLNCIEPMVVAAELGLPVVNADGMGRAFPELQMYGPFMCGGDAFPCSLVSADGRVRACTRCRNATELEEYMRSAVFEFGCVGATAIRALEKEELQNCVPDTVSDSYHLGHAVLTARRSNTDPVQAIVDAKPEDRRVIVRGKIVLKNIGTTRAFAEGNIVVEALVADDPARTRYQVDIQNEFICCHRLDVGFRTLVVCVPHLITVVDVETGFPITTEELLPGQRVAVVAMRAPELLLRPNCLPVVGPRYFMRDEKQYGVVTEPVFPA